MIVRYENCESERQRLAKIICGRADFFLPLSIIAEGERLVGIYDTGGYTKLADIYFEADMVYDFAVLFFGMIEHMRDFLFFPDRSVLSRHNIFIDSDFKEIRLAYIRDVETGSEKKRVLNLFYSLKKKCSGKCRGQIDEIMRMYASGNGDVFRMLAAVNDMKRNRAVL